MSMNVSSIGSNKFISADVGSGAQSGAERPIQDSDQGVLTSTINTTESMQLAELRGMKVSVGDEQKIKMLDKAIKAMEGPQTTLHLSVHKETNTIMIKVMDKDTGELIREIPPEKTLDVAAKLMEVAGILVDHRI
ncbi:flagellar protein FlaG [Paenibacillus sp. UNC496MF]|uniref:flagellar protein FlaG n=1 Tax=Paenibacillus sp. UNC496MF TaxID=1502753 RepID=UPI0008E142B0|nr:flagellar protein FlaG [Paenibacillus sp. UNC496MF]SFJ26881.1 flagellar protein FlaG [Paenibacillus sp. UNC496MF]